VGNVKNQLGTGVFALLLLFLLLLLLLLFFFLFDALKW